MDADPYLSRQPSSVLLPANGIFDLMVETEGVLHLPVELAERVGLIAGDILSLEMGATSVSLEIYREFLGENWQAYSPESRWLYISQFLSRPLTAAGRLGAIPIPSEVFPVAAGEAVVLQVLRLGLVHRLFLFRSDPE